MEDNRCFPLQSTLEEEDVYTNSDKLKKFHLGLAHRGAILQQVMPLAMRNLAIAQQRDKDRFRHVRGGKYDRPQSQICARRVCPPKQSKENTL